MSNVHELPNRDDIYEQASQWIARIDRSLSLEETQELKNWLAADKAHQAVLLEMAELWDKMDAMQRLSSLFPEPETRPSRWLPYSLASAASVILVVLSLWLFIKPPHISSSQDISDSTAANTPFTYQTDIGEQSTVTLQDGTQLVLNTNSKVLVQYTDQARLLTLQRGEISVKVAKDPSRPLSVFAGEQVVQAVGTEFNLEINDQQRVELMVLEGKVRVGVHAAPSAEIDIANPGLLPQSSTTLTAGESLLLGQAEESITEITADEMAVKLSWRQGKLIFRGESLAEAVEEVSRYTAVEFIIKDEELKNIRVAGLFRAGDVDGLLATLQENFNIVYQYADNQTVELNAAIQP